MLAPHRFYYLHNFQRALDWVAMRYSDLLDAQEQQFLTQFAQLPQASQALLVRMVMRRGPWFRASKLGYEEIPDTIAAAQPLLTLGWLSQDESLGLNELFGLHTKHELLLILNQTSLQRSMRKSDMLALLAAQNSIPQPYKQWHPEAPEPVWRVMVGTLCERFRLMFFGNLYQDWSEFVLADLGVFQYESVAFDAASRAFQSRADVDLYLALQTCRERVHALDDVAAQVPELLQTVAQYRSANPWLEQRRAKVLLRTGQACERVQQWALAEQAYRQSHYPGARHRLLRVLERLERFDEALALAQQAQHAPESEEERQRLQRMLPRLQRSVGQGSRTRSAALAPVVAQLREDMVLPLPAQPMSVEYVLRDHWSTPSAPVFYVENALINSLFGLLCWPAIFAPLPGAFFHPFQSGPADLYAPDFVQRRSREFAACLDRLEDGSYRQHMLQCFAGKQGLQSPFVFWGALSAELLALALDCIPAAHLQLLFSRLLQDLKANRTGFPDLVRFWPAEQRYALVEVKAPGDKLQDNQIRWLAYCSAHGIPVSVCHVKWSAPTANAALAA